MAFVWGVETRQCLVSTVSPALSCLRYNCRVKSKIYCKRLSGVVYRKIKPFNCNIYPYSNWQHW